MAPTYILEGGRVQRVFPDSGCGTVILKHDGNDFPVFGDPLMPEGHNLIDLTDKGWRKIGIVTPADPGPLELQPGIIAEWRQE